MITFKQGSLIHKAFLLPLSDEEGWKHQKRTNLCFLMQTLLLRLPVFLLGIVVLGPPIAILIGIVEGVIWTKNKICSTMQPRPSRLKIWYLAIKGKLCPTVIFE